MKLTLSNVKEIKRGMATGMLLAVEAFCEGDEL